jgi:hypothetical protein
MKPHFTYEIRKFLTENPGSTVEQVTLGLNMQEYRRTVARILSNMYKHKKPQVTREDGKYTLVRVPENGDSIEQTRRYFEQGGTIEGYNAMVNERKAKWKRDHPDRVHEQYLRRKAKYIPKGRPKKAPEQRRRRGEIKDPQNAMRTNTRWMTVSSCVRCA